MILFKTIIGPKFKKRNLY